MRPLNLGLTLALARRNLRRNPRRTWLDAASVCAVTMLLIFVPAMQHGAFDAVLRTAINASSGYAQIQHPDWLADADIRNGFVPGPALRASLASLPADVPVAPRIQTFALLATDQRSVGAGVTGVDPGLEAAWSSLPQAVVAGRYLIGEDEIVLGTTLARALALKPGDDVTLLGTGPDGSMAFDRLRVVGLLHTGTPDYDRVLAQASLTRLNESFSLNGQIHALVIGADLSQGRQILAGLRENLTDDVRLRDWVEMQPAIHQMILYKAIGVVVIFGLLVIIVSFTLVNSMLMATIERTREFGMSLAIGVGPGLLARVLYAENLMKWLIGLSVGIALGCSVTALVAWWGIPLGSLQDTLAAFNMGERIRPKLSWLAALVGPGVMLTVLCLFGLWPLLKVRRLDALTAMRAP